MVDSPPKVTYQYRYIIRWGRGSMETDGWPNSYLSVGMKWEDSKKVGKLSNLIPRVTECRNISMTYKKTLFILKMHTGLLYNIIK